MKTLEQIRKEAEEIVNKNLLSIDMDCVVYIKEYDSCFNVEFPKKHNSRKLVNHRIFENMKQYQQYIFHLDDSSDAMLRGLSCPANVRWCVDKINSLEKF